MWVGFNITFFPMHILGLAGMPRRIATYMAGRGWAIRNLIATIGAFMIALFGSGLYLNCIKLRNGERAGNDPWEGNTLEWKTTCPPPEYNFAEIPTVNSDRPFFDERMRVPDALSHNSAYCGKINTPGFVEKPGVFVNANARVQIDLAKFQRIASQLATVLRLLAHRVAGNIVRITGCGLRAQIGLCVLATVLPLHNSKASIEVAHRALAGLQPAIVIVAVSSAGICMALAARTPPHVHRQPRVGCRSSRPRCAYFCMPICRNRNPPHRLHLHCGHGHARCGCLHLSRNCALCPTW